MVKGRHRSISSSDDSEEEEQIYRKNRKERRRDDSSSSEDSFHKNTHRSKHQRDRSRSQSPFRDKHKKVRVKPDPDRPPRIKPDPDRPRESQTHRHHGKRERDDDRAPRHRDEEQRHRDDRNRPVRIKQEPRDDFGQQRQERRRNNDRRVENFHRRRRQEEEESAAYGSQDTGNSEETSAQPKEQPNFEVSGKLTEDTNTYKGVVIKYNEPPEARKPKKRWRLYPFKNDESLKPFHMHRQSAYLFGRDRIIADIPVDHPSCSKQHAVFQYRLVPYEKEDGRRAHKIAPYIIDLDSANGTYINNKKIEPQRYYELFEKDVVKFGYSSRDYVLLHDRSDTREIEDDQSD